MMKKGDLSSDIDMSKVLVAGDIDIAFADAERIPDLASQICANINDAIEVAAKGDFQVIAVVISGVGKGLLDSLKKLRKVNSTARIILLAKMLEEPTAIKLISSGRNGTRPADDYLICPIKSENFYQSLLAAKPQKQQIIETTPFVDTHSQEKIKYLEQLATTDELTGLKNRRYILEFARQIIDRAKKENGRATLLVFDIDDFKHYNDVYGHTAGDEILKQAAVLIHRCCRPHDAVGRIGGDEFMVVFWDDPKRKNTESETERRSALAEHPNAVLFIANRFRAELSKAELPMLGPEGRGVLAISGGLASYPRDGVTVKELFSQADKALLKAKRSGKNRIYLVGAPQSDIADIQ